MDPETGASTQTIEGLWHHVKAYIPEIGMHAKYLESHLGAFMWTRYAKQRGLDMFIFFLECAADINKPFRTTYSERILPKATMKRKETQFDDSKQNTKTKMRGTVVFSKEEKVNDTAHPVIHLTESPSYEL